MLLTSAALVTPASLAPSTAQLLALCNSLSAHHVTAGGHLTGRAVWPDSWRHAPCLLWLLWPCTLVRVCIRTHCVHVCVLEGVIRDMSCSHQRCDAASIAGPACPCFLMCVHLPCHRDTRYGSKRVAEGTTNGGHVMNVVLAAVFAGFGLGQASPAQDWAGRGPPGAGSDG